MGVVYEALVGLAPEHDAEIVEGYQRYEAILANVLSEEQMERYAASIQEVGEVRVFDEMSPDELAELPTDMAVIAANVLGDLDASMENRRVAALLNQRGQHDLAPDLSPPSLS